MSVSEATKPPTAFSNLDESGSLAPYRAVSKAAMVSLILAILTLIPGVLWQLMTAGSWLLNWLPGSLGSMSAALLFALPVACGLALVVLSRFQPRLAAGLAIGLLLALLPGGMWIMGLMSPGLLLLPLVGGLLGLIAWRNIRRYPAELTGMIPAVLGTGVCLALFFGGLTAQAVIYATEVPEGYDRIAFEMLKAGSRQPDVPPPSALELDGKRVFIKGYIYPGQQRTELKQFVLVPDLGTCCFGGNPRLTHMVEVTLTGSKTIDYAMTKRKLAGTLKVNPTLQPVNGRPGVYYQLTADYAQ